MIMRITATKNLINAKILDNYGILTAGDHLQCHHSSPLQQPSQ